MRKRVIRASVILLGLVAITLIGELAARRYFDGMPWEVPFRLQRPLPYQNAAYWSPDFIYEEWSPSMTFDATHGFWHLDDFSGHWYHIKNGSRQTVPLVMARHRIYIFGSSTLYGSGVPDEDTIASYLQRMISDYQVVNMGTAGDGSAEQVARLKTVSLQANDIVIFYDGAIDVELLYNANACATSIALYRLICHPPMPADTEIADRIARYSDHIAAAKSYVEAASAYFYHFLQPQLWSRPLSVYEQTLTANYNLVPRDMDRVFARVWSALQQTPDTLDLTHVLDSARAAGHAYYLDYIHTNDEANAIIAVAIYNSLDFTF